MSWRACVCVLCVRDSGQKRERESGQERERVGKREREREREREGEKDLSRSAIIFSTTTKILLR